jgi:hypothetical protein
MWELHRLPDDKNTFNATNPFCLSTFKTQWPTCSGQFMGVTSSTVEEIQLEGACQSIAPLTIALRIVKERPDYELFENNCQNFARYLVEKISPGSFCPNTIKHVLEEWRILATDSKRRLPGAYPNSIISTVTESGMYFTARENNSESDSSSQRRKLLSVFLDDSASGT